MVMPVAGLLGSLQFDAAQPNSVLGPERSLSFTVLALMGLPVLGLIEASRWSLKNLTTSSAVTRWASSCPKELHKPGHGVPVALMGRGLASCRLGFPPPSVEDVHQEGFDLALGSRGAGGVLGDVSLVEPGRPMSPRS